MEIKLDIRQAMILAAGFGIRMKPITDSIPKPMIKIAGKTMIERIIDDLISSGIIRIVINTCYKADILENYLLSKYSDMDNIEIVFSREEELLESGGGVLNSLRKGYLKNEPFVLCNSDMVYLGNIPSELKIMRHIHMTNCSGITLSFKRPAEIYGIEDLPIYFLNHFTSQAHRSVSTNSVQPEFCYVGISIISPTIFEKCDKPNNKFSMSLCFAKASELGLLSAKIFNGHIFHIDRPEKISEFSSIVSQIENRGTNLVTSRTADRSHVFIQK